MRGILITLIVSLAPLCAMADPHFSRYDSSHCLGSYYPGQTTSGWSGNIATLHANSIGT